MKQPVEKVRVITDARDATKDYFIAAPIAEECLKLGLLAWDATNSAYTEMVGPQ